MDAYEYLLTKLGFKVRHISELQHIHRFQNCNEKSCAWDFFEDDTEVGVYYSHINREIACKFAVNYLTNFLHSDFVCSARFQNIYTTLKILLNTGSTDLESCEEVDLLLTLNGLNNNEHLNSR